MKNPTTVYVIAEVKPEKVFYQKDMAEAAAAEATANVPEGTEGAFEAFPVVITTKNAFRKAIREATLASLTEDQKKALGFIKTPRKKRATKA